MNRDTRLSRLFGEDDANAGKGDAVDKSYFPAYAVGPVEPAAPWHPFRLRGFSLLLGRWIGADPASYAEAVPFAEAGSPDGQPNEHTAERAPVDDGAISDWAYFHQGGRLEAATELHQFRNRDYSGALGRWVVQDSAAFEEGVTVYPYIRDEAEDAGDLP